MLPGSLWIWTFSLTRFIESMNIPWTLIQSHQFIKFSHSLLCLFFFLHGSLPKRDEVELFRIRQLANRNFWRYIHGWRSWLDGNGDLGDGDCILTGPQLGKTPWFFRFNSQKTEVVDWYYHGRKWWCKSWMDLRFPSWSETAVRTATETEALGDGRSFQVH